MSSNIARIVRWALWISGLCASFLIPPPVEIFGSSSVRGQLTLTQFVVAVIFGLCAAVGSIYKHPTSWLRWWAFTAVALLALITGLVRYGNLRSTMIVSVDKQECIIGSQFTRAFTSHNPPPYPSARELLESSGTPEGPDAEEIWTRDSISRNRAMLTWSYLALLPFLVFSVFGLVQCLMLTATTVEAPPEGRV